jgi:uncharacterized protein (TIGR00303 family)
MIRVYTQLEQGNQWLQRYQGTKPVFACVLGFTDTGLIPGISAAGATPHDRQYTCLADAEFLINGVRSHPKYPLPPLHAGASPVLISRAVVEGLCLPTYLFNAGLPQPPVVPTIDLGGSAAKCLSQGCALELKTVQHLLQQGLIWGEKLAAIASQGYVIIGECVVGGTTTALSVLTGLGVDAAGKVNSSHPVCNHEQKWQIVQTGIKKVKISLGTEAIADPLQLIAAVGDPMQVVVAGMAISASCYGGVLLAGGTQMLAVYALIQSIVKTYNLPWQPTQVVVGTTRWVAEDPTGNTVKLAAEIANVPLLATQLSFALSAHAQLRAYERGFVKEGMGAGGTCIAASLTQGWQQIEMFQAIENLASKYLAS